MNVSHWKEEQQQRIQKFLCKKKVKANSTSVNKMYVSYLSGQEKQHVTFRSMHVTAQDLKVLLNFQFGTSNQIYCTKRNKKEV